MTTELTVKDCYAIAEAKTKLVVDKLDFYYLITCSRGPGTETLTVQKIDPKHIENLQDWRYEEDKIGMPGAEQFAKFGVCCVTVKQEYDTSEGVVLAVEKNSLPLNGLYRYFLWEDQEWPIDIHDIPTTNEEMKDALKLLNQAFHSNRAAYISAQLRAFVMLAFHRDFNETYWTSCNAWRKLQLEMPSYAEFLLYQYATGQTAEELGKWNCEVMQEAAKRYLNGTLISEPSCGC